MSILLGLLALCAGGYGIYHWVGDLFTVLKGLLPLCLVCGGLMTIAAGISSLKK